MSPHAPKPRPTVVMFVISWYAASNCSSADIDGRSVRARTPLQAVMNPAADNAHAALQLVTDMAHWLHWLASATLLPLDC